LRRHLGETKNRARRPGNPADAGQLKGITVMSTLSRRGFLNLVGKAGGVSAVYQTMAAMGLLSVPAAYAGPPSLPPGNGTRVVILGAGIAGMVAALELGKAGYECRVLEARSRPGGRNWTLRGGDTVEEVDSTQRIAWEAADHLYFNPGPARLPHHHQGILGYCRELGVPVEVMVNDNRAAWLHDDNAFGGMPQRARAVINDQRGYVAELAAKAVDAAALGDPVSAEDRERLRAFLKEFGALRPRPRLSRIAAFRVYRAPGSRHSIRHVCARRSTCGNYCGPSSGMVRPNSARAFRRPRRCCSPLAAWGESATL
jgi:monoamine oxidase